MSKRVVIGMSGGVDSSVATVLLKEKGHDVVGLFMHNWEETEGGFCTAEQDYQDVKSVCNTLGVPYYSVNFSKQYMDRVFAHFLREYSLGRTPNPDVLCNREIKFDAFKAFCGGLEADYIATGHYVGLQSVRVEEVPCSDFSGYFCKESSDKNASSNGAGKQQGMQSLAYVHRLKRAKCAEKDQSYFLNQLTQSQLGGVLFPLADLQKHEVREIATKYGLSTADKKDSTGICFIGERKFKDFLQTYLPAQSGDIKTVDGVLVGRHDGLMYYTLGQRKGLGIGGRAGFAGDRWFVVDKDLSTNTLIVSEGEHELLFSRALVATEFNFIAPQFITASEGSDANGNYVWFNCTAKFRYRQPDQDVRVKVYSVNRVEIEFAQPQRAITEGQYAVLYNGEWCLGGGVIEKRVR